MARKRKSGPFTCRKCGWTQDDRPKACPECNRRRGREFWAKKRKERELLKSQLPPIPEGCKQCSRCREIKSIDSFWLSERKKDGRQSNCISCAKESAAAHRIRKIRAPVSVRSKYATKDLSSEPYHPIAKGMMSAQERRRLRMVWHSMIQRCYEKSASAYSRYGGRGIRVCERWLESFDVFAIDVGVRPSSTHQLDRINNDGNYEPGNVRWATPAEQARNSRAVRMISFNGMTMCISDWAKLLGLEKTGIRRRLKRYPIEIALTHRKCERHERGALQRALNGED